MTSHPPTPLAELVNHTASQLEQAGVHYGHGTTCAYDEAAWLVLHALHLPLDTDLHGTAGQALVSTDAQAPVHALLKERIRSRKPLAYLIQQAWLQGVPFYVDERCIVPRSLIAEAIASGSIDCWLSAHTRRVLDLCTGGGSLAVLAALAWPDVQVDAADISPDALDVARINVQQHGLDARITLLHSDGLAQCRPPYDLILCNPPYVNAESMAALPPEYRAEPKLALCGNTAGSRDGMDFIRPLLAAAPAHMAADAVLVLEIGHERAHFEAAFPHLHPVWLDTSAGSDQVLLLTHEMLQAAS